MAKTQIDITKFSLAELKAAVATKLTEDAQPLLKEWDEMQDRRPNLITEIQDIIPDWKPTGRATRIDLIIKEVLESGPKTVEEIVKGLPNQNADVVKLNIENRCSGTRPAFKKTADGKIDYLVFRSRSVNTIGNGVAVTIGD